MRKAVLVGLTLAFAAFPRVSDDGKEYGVDSLDPPLWAETKYLLTGDSHRKVLALLDEFLAQHGKRLVTDPICRAISQHDLWAVFNWADGAREEGRRALQERLAKIMQRVALTRAEIESLPENLTQSTAPADLLSEKGPWVCVYQRGGGPSAPAHSRFFRQSYFLVFVSLPQGRTATLAYLKGLDDFPNPLQISPNRAGVPPIMRSNPALPQFPPGTRVALLRRALLLNNEGDVVAARLTESLQIRVYKTIPQEEFASSEQDNLEFRLSRPLLFAGKSGGLRQLDQDKELQFL